MTKKAGLTSMALYITSGSARGVTLGIKNKIKIFPSNFNILALKRLHKVLNVSHVHYLYVDFNRSYAWA